MVQKPLSVAKLIIYLLFCIAIALWGVYNTHEKSIITGFTPWLGGLFFWTLAEYLVHRFLFHPWGGIGNSALLADHGRHHRLPEEMATGFLNPLPGIPLLLAIGALIYPFAGAYAYFFLSGFTLGYVGYILVHYTIHRRKPPFKWIAILWRHHFLHHFHKPNKCFGVTTIFWDRLFGTWENNDEVKLI